MKDPETSELGPQINAIITPRKLCTSSLLIKMHKIVIGLSFTFATLLATRHTLKIRQMVFIAREGSSHNPSEYQTLFPSD